MSVKNEVGPRKATRSTAETQVMNYITRNGAESADKIAEVFGYATDTVRAILSLLSDSGELAKWKEPSLKGGPRRSVFGLPGSMRAPNGSGK